MFPTLINSYIMKRILLILLLLLLFVKFLFSQTVRFNRDYDSLFVDTHPEFTDVFETDSGYVAFDTYNFKVFQLDSLGVIQSIKSFKDTNTLSDEYLNFGSNMSCNLQGNALFQVSGHINLSLDTTSVCDFHFAKYNQQFDTLWTSKICKTTVVGNFDFPGILYDCLVDSSGSIYATGIGRKLLNGQYFTSKYNLFLLKADSMGEPIWLKTYPFIDTSEYSFGRRIIETSDNGLLIGGSLKWVVNMSLVDDADLYLLKLTKDGDPLWQKKLGNPNYGDNLGDIIETNSGIIAAGSYNLGELNPQGDNAGYGYLANLSLSGDIQWEQKIGSVSYHNAIHSVKELQDGSLIAVMTYADYASYGLQIELIHLTQNGDILWRRPIFLELYNTGINHSIQPYDLKEASDYGFIIAGKVQKPVKNCPFLIKTDSMGCDGLYSCMDTTIMMYLQSWEDSVCDGDSVLVSIAIANGNAPFMAEVNQSYTIEKPLYIMPDTTSHLFYAYPTLSNPTVEVTVTDKHGQSYTNYITFNMVDCTLSDDEEMSFEMSFKLYPNPASESIQLDIFKGRGLKSKLEIYNQAGKLVWEIPQVRHQMQIDVSQLPGGVYYFKLIGDKGIGVEKFVKL